MASTGTHKQPAAVRKAEQKRQIRAELSTYNQSPRKVRLVTDMVKGKKIADAVAALSFLPKRAALPIKKLIESAVANGIAKGEDKDALRVANIQVNSAGMIKKYMPRAMGRAAPIRKRRSNVIVTLSVETPSTPTA